MSKDTVAQWDTDPDLNTDIQGINLAEGQMVVSAVNNAIRTVMSQIKAEGFLTSSTAVLVANIATSANFIANTADKVLDTDGVWGASAEVTLTDAATVAVDMSTFINAKVTLGGNRTLGQPSNAKVGQAGAIRLIQDGTGSRTLAFHADWKFAFGADPVLTMTAAAVDVLYYRVLATNVIHASLSKAIA